MSDHHLIVVIFVFVSFGCFFFFCCCLYALWCFLIKNRKKECVQETEIIRDDEHFKVKKDVVEGPCGAEAVVISMEKDKHFEEKIMKREKEMEEKYMQGKNGGIAGTDVEAGESSGNPAYQFIEYKP